MIKNKQLQHIPRSILGLAKAALTQANMHAVYMDPGSEHWPMMSILNTAHAGELFIKAIIANEHPLLIFKDLFGLDDNKSDELDFETLLARGKTHDFEKLPQVLWAVTGHRIPNPDCYERIRRARNAIQHFCPPSDTDLSQLSLEFIHTIIDPLIYEKFNLYAIEYHEDHSVSYDYVVASLLRRQLRFTLPPDFNVTEIDLLDELQGSSAEYMAWFKRELEQINRASLIKT